MKYFLSIIIVILLLNSCIDKDDPVLGEYTIKNNSGDTIVYLYYPYRLSIYDTILPEDNPHIDIKRDDSYILKPYSAKTYVIWGGNSSTNLQSYMDKYVMIFYFLNYDSINTLPWSKIRERNIIMKRVTIDTKQDLENCNFEITYP